MPDAATIQTKLTPPRIQTVVTRTRLHERLDAHPGQSILLSAPAGFGKTVLILDWLAATGRPVAWVSVDRFDNDPVRFFTHLAAAIARLPMDGSDGVSRADRAAALVRQLATGTPQISAELVAALADLGREAVVVLDDIHELDSRSVLGPLEALLQVQTERPLLVLLTRVDPALGMGRLRLDGDLLELRERDLRVTLEEAVDLFDRLLPGGIDRRLVEQLEQRTEGWVAGLRLAAIALRDAEDPAAAVASFAGTHRYIVEYLLEEAVERQSDAVQQFLMDTSVLQRFRPKTCVAVTGDPQAAARLAEVEAANLFLVPLGSDRCWYRYHRLFGELLQFRLRRLCPDRVDALHLRASRWFEREGDVHTALEHASQVADPVPLLELLDAHGIDMLSRSELSMLRHWLDRVPDPLSQPYPMMLSVLGWLRVISDRAPGLPPILSAIDRAIEHVPDGYDPVRKRHAALQRDILSGFAARYAGRFREAIEISARTLVELSDDEPLLRGLLTFNTARAHMALGDMDAAAPLLEHAFNDNLRAGNSYLVLAGLGQAAAVAAQREGVKSASASIAAAVALAEEQGLTSLPAFSTVLYHLGHIRYLADSLEDARKAFDRAATIGKAADFPEGRANGLVGLARVALARHAFDDAEALLVEAAALARTSNVVLLDTTMALEQARLAFAREVAGAAPSPTPAGPFDAADDGEWTTIEETTSILELWGAVRAGGYDRALAVVDRLERESGRRGRGVALCSAQLARALLPAADDGRWERVQEMLELTARRGYIRPILDAGEPARALLQAAGARPLSPAARAWAATLLERFDAHGEAHAPQRPAEVVELLTDREEEVLAYLFQEMSNKAIARSMYVSVETVKTHLKHLYGKLGVSNRRQAVARAREIGVRSP